MTDIKYRVRGRARSGRAIFYFPQRISNRNNIGNTNNAFRIDPSTGIISVNNKAALDFETMPTFELMIEADDVGNKISQNITINLNDVNEAPIIDDQTFAFTAALTETCIGASADLSRNLADAAERTSRCPHRPCNHRCTLLSVSFALGTTAV